jgi:AsmA protein
MKKLFIGLGAIVVLIIAAALIIPPLIPLETYKEEIQAKVKETTGRDFLIKGDIGLSLFPSIAVAVEDVSFANAPGAKAEQMAEISKLELALQVAPLLTGEIAVDRFVLIDPVINLEVDAEGKPNWDIATGADKPSEGSGTAETGEAGAVSLADLRLGDVRLENGRFTYHDQTSGQELMVSEMNLQVTLSKMDAPLTATGSAVWNGEKIELELGADNLAQLMAGAPSGVSTKVQAAPVSFSFDGNLAAGGEVSVEGNIDLDVPSIRNLAAWTGNALEAPGDTFGPFRAKGQVKVAGQTVSLNGAEVKFDAIGATGDVFVDAGGTVPFIKATLEVDRLDVNPYMAGQGGGSDGAAVPAAPDTAGPGDWSDDPIDVSALKTVDAELSLSTGGIQFQEIKIDRSTLTVTLKGGKMTANLVEMNLYDGRGSGNLAVDGSGKTPAITAEFDLADFQAEPFLKDAAEFDRLLGTAESKFSLATSGGTERQLVSNLKGSGNVVFRDGAVRGMNIGAMVRDVSVSAIKGGFDEAESTDFAELSGSFTIDKGVVSNDDLKLVAPLLRVSGAGTIPLPPRTVDYRVEPKVVGTATGQGGDEEAKGLAVPIIVEGPWHDLSYKPDLASLASDPSKLLENVEGLKDITGGTEGALQGILKPGSEDGDSGAGAAQDAPKKLLKGLFGD